MFNVVRQQKQRSMKRKGLIMIALNDFKRETDCIYKYERYSVRDNAAVLPQTRGISKRD